MKQWTSLKVGEANIYNPLDKPQSLDVICKTVNYYFVKKKKYFLFIFLKFSYFLTSLYRTLLLIKINTV